MEGNQVPSEIVNLKHVRSCFLVVKGTIKALREDGLIDDRAERTLRLACKFFDNEVTTG